MDGGLLSALGSGAGTITAVIAILLGLLVCFFGFRLLRIVFALCGFALGAVLGHWLASELGGGATSLLWIAAVVGGLIGAALSMALYKLGVFTVGAVAGAVLGRMIGTSLSGNLPIIAIILAALLVGIVAVFFQRIVIVLATAFSGSWLVAQTGTALLAGRTMAWGDLPSNRFIPDLSGAALGGFFATWLVLGIAGAVVQFRPKK